MATNYNVSNPADDETIANGPGVIRVNQEALKNDGIVNAGTVNGLTTGNLSGNIPVSNGNVNANLNAEKLQGKTPADFAPAGWVPPVATSSSTGSMSGTDKAKLDTVATNAEVNQNAFSNVKAGSTTLQADSKTDTLEVVGGANITVTPDAVNDRLTFAVSGKVPNAASADYATTATNVSGGTVNATTVTTSNVITTGNGTGNNIKVGDDAYIGDINIASAIRIKGVSNGNAGLIRFGNSTNSFGWDGASLIFGSNTIIHSGNIGSQSVNYATSAGNADTVDGKHANDLAVVPSGGIIMWSGSVANIPSGWALCNGSNGTPDLRNKFIVGAGSTYSVGATGGETTHTLTINEMPAHTHTGNYPDTQDSYHPAGSQPYGARNFGTHETSNVGGGAAHNNMPPYYALCFIMKL